jgi:hypothetical protein
MLYHVFARGIDKQCIFTDDADSQSSRSSPRHQVAAIRRALRGVRLVWNHYHFL